MHGEAGEEGGQSRCDEESAHPGQRLKYNVDAHPPLYINLFLGFQVIS